MTSNCLPWIIGKFSNVPSYQFGNCCVSRITSPVDHDTLSLGIAMWYGIILDFNVMFCTADQASSNRGRVLKHVNTGWPDDPRALEYVLEYLDELGDLLIKEISQPSEFKAHSLRKGVQTWSVGSWFTPMKGVILSLVDAALHHGEGGVQCVRMLRQISCFLKKLDIKREDLAKALEEQFIKYEHVLCSFTDQCHSSLDYLRNTFEMKALLSEHLGKFDISVIVPGHGPGAVAQPGIGSWYEKHTVARPDKRIGYLLAHAGLGHQKDYLPLLGEEPSERTSRFIAVPKTWKKMRGISAEPPELQFWQQGILDAIDRMFTTDKWWASRINLHCQEQSRQLARQGSVDGSLATIDLSNASDSVTLQLVKDVFGNTHLGRWLIGSRSVFTECGDATVRINKFAPMGSACCFPVECIIFCLAAELAVRRTYNSLQKVKTVRVFGDDIILPTYAAQELLTILDSLGFTVNTDKSFWSGFFREACGTEAWYGHDIAPCRFKTFGTQRFGCYADLAQVSSITAFVNELYNRGLHDTRYFLLSYLFSKRIKLGRNATVSVQATLLYSFSGQGGTLISPFPTNFNLKKKFDRGLQCLKYRRVVWLMRKKHHRHTIGDLPDGYDVCEYVTWLIRHQPGWRDYDTLWSKGWVETVSVDPVSRLPLDIVMVPTLKWVQPSY